MNTNWIARWIMIAIVVFAFAGAFATIMTAELNRNEHMYHAAGVFVSHGQALYEDFAYLQTPYLPLLYGTLYNVFGVSAYYLLIARLFSFLSLGLAATILFLIARRVLTDTVMALGIVALFLLNMAILQPATEISNYILPVAFSFAGFYVFLGVDQGKAVDAALAGFLVALAIGTKLTYAGVMMAFIAAAMVYPVVKQGSDIASGRHALRLMVPFTAGAAIGLLPILAYLADLEVFRFNNLGYHQANTEWREMTGYTGATSLLAKMAYAFAVLRQPDNLIVCMGIAFGLVLPFDSLSALKRSVTRPGVGGVLALFLIVLAVPVAMAPTPSFVQYYAMPVSFLFLVLVHVCAPHSARGTALTRRGLMILTVAALALNGPALLKRVIGLTERGAWIGLRVHDVSMEMGKTISNQGVDVQGPIATLSPIFAIEANLPVYPQFSTGPFLFRVGDLLTAEQRKHFVGTSRATVAELLDSDPPAAILAGFEKELDGPLIEYAHVNRYRLADVAGLNGQLYIRPAAAASLRSVR